MNLKIRLRDEREGNLFLFATVVVGEFVYFLLLGLLYLCGAPGRQWAPILLIVPASAVGCFVAYRVVEGLREEG